MKDTIAAISTPFGEGAIAVLRLSGPQAVQIVQGIFRAKKPLDQCEARRAMFGAIHDAFGKIDDVLVTLFRAPASYTGEDVVEIGCHGGILVSRRILELLLSSGARAAEPGEFTQRAFLRGKLDLTQAEAVMDLIQAQTDLALRAANEQLEGKLGGRLNALRETLLEVLAHVEAYIDFPDEDISPDTGAAFLERLEHVQLETERLLATADQGRILQHGLRTVICGAPNAGKSSLLNALSGFDRAIVSEQAGTTRDVLEEVINARGIPVRLIDTAGLRESHDQIELQGIERARKQIERADLVLEVVDGTQSPDLREPTPPARCRVLVLNKCDLGLHPAWKETEGVRISALNGDGLESLLDEVERAAASGHAAARDWSVAINARHHDCLQRAHQFCGAGISAFREKLSPEFIAEEIRAALNAIGEVVGKTDTEELLGAIFGRFCIGK